MAYVDARGRTVFDEGAVDHLEKGGVLSLWCVRCDDAARGMDGGGSTKRKIRIKHADVLKNGIRHGAMTYIRRYADDCPLSEWDHSIYETQLSARLRIAQDFPERMAAQRKGRYAALGFEYA